jgi:branched-subunit amino acid transport protein AzlD
MDNGFVLRTSLGKAVIYAFVMGAVILFCRAFPFLFFRDKPPEEGRTTAGNKVPALEGLKKKDLRESFLALVEKIVPPAAKTVLAFNAIAAPLKEDRVLALPVLAASALTALLHVWKRNPLFSIVGGTALYMALIRF